MAPIDLHVIYCVPIRIHVRIQIQRDYENMIKTEIASELRIDRLRKKKKKEGKLKARDRNPNVRRDVNLFVAHDAIWRHQ